TDARKSVRDAEINLENAKLSYEKSIKPATELEIRQAENALFKAEDNLDKEALAAYDAALSGLAKLPEAISGIYDLIYDTDFGFEMTNLNYYKTLALLNKDGAAKAASLTEENYKKAKSLYKSVSSDLIAFDSEGDEILNYLESVYEGVKAGLEAAQAERNFIMLVRDDFDSRNQDIPYFLSNDLKTAETYVSSLQSELSNLASKKSAFRDAVLSVAEKKDDLEELKNKPDALTLSTAKISLSQRENSLTDAKEKLNDHYIRAPFDGTVAKMNIKNSDSVSSDSVSSGSSIATIVSEKSMAEISLNETDISRVKIGQKAVLDFDSTDDVVIAGTIIEVDAVGSSSQGVVSYGAKIAFESEDERIKSGMSVNA
ncbi:MAG TPA: HlyD family efflux transporter periplasmic adaptor subunit, partial [Candidatus Colwellbacteria bacterium]|nr:HlyD family efflux transporter periplasmic adaptor subunit [Candidatus Colwellbacteria bacterium]